MSHLFYLCYYLIIYYIVRCFSLKQSRQKISHNQDRKFLFSLQPHDSLLLIVVAWFAFSSQHSVFEHHEQILLFLRACDQRVCASFGLLIFVSDPILASRMACQAVKIGQDFRKTIEWSLCLGRSFPCISNSYLLLPSQKPIQMPPFGTILLTIRGTCNMVVVD